MKLDKAYTMECPFVQRKCKANKCMGWNEAKEGCLILIFCMKQLVSESSLKEKLDLLG